ncbi:MAG: response regulator [Limnobacter sp.]|nr:response regulator [Limnobacter sp.]
MNSDAYFTADNPPPEGLTRFSHLSSSTSDEDFVLDDMQSKHLLLVDDDPNLLVSLVRLLKKDGYDVHCAHSAREAFDILANHPIDVVLSDHRMPEMSGTDFLEQVKDIYPHTVRLVLSGFAELESVTEAINRGAIYKYLTKPCDDQNLRANIREAFQRHDMEQQNNRLKIELEHANAELVQLNHILEQRVIERNDRIQRDNDFRHVIQEVFDHLPVGILGIDVSGDVMMINRIAAVNLDLGQGMAIGRSLLCMPEELASAVEKFLDDVEQIPVTFSLSIQDQTVKAALLPMGIFSKSRGCLVTLTFPEPNVL